MLTKLCLRDIRTTIGKFAAIAAIIALFAFHKLNGVREGTVISALLVGFITRVANKRIGEQIQHLLQDHHPSHGPRANMPPAA